MLKKGVKAAFQQLAKMTKSKIECALISFTAFAIYVEARIGASQKTT